MTTTLQGSFYAPDAFTVRFTLAPSSHADFSVAAGTTYADIDAVLTAWNAVLSGVSCSVARVTNAANHTASVEVTIPSGTFSIDWSHLGDGSSLRDYLGEVGNLSGESDGYTFDNPLAAGWFPPYDLRSLSISGEPYDVQRLMTGSGAITTNDPHSNTGDGTKYTANAVFWFGDSSSYVGQEALRDFVEGVLEYGQPFVIKAPIDTYTCEFNLRGEFELIPEPVEDVRRGYIYQIAIPVVVNG